jgi:phospholipid/cholesterol/gamma-HCH transport system permease protein
VTEGAASTPDAGLARDGDTLIARGDWVLDNIGALARRVEQLSGDGARLDFSGINRLDASGALLLERLLCRAGMRADESGMPAEWRPVFDAVDQACDEGHAPEPRTEPQWRQVLERIGRTAVDVAHSTRELLGFMGVTMHRLGRVLLRPGRLPLTATVHHMEQSGMDAAPLLLLLSSLVGAVIAFLGATILRQFGAELFVVDLVTFAFVREFGVLLTAILLAGRTASAFCAHIGMMKSREEIDAIRTMGLDEIELLVLPRLIALVIVLPLLTFLATIAGLFGGLVVAVLSLDVNLAIYIDRVQENLRLTDYLVGMLKAPVFAVVIAITGCLEGLRVSGTAQSVGEHTTTAVVRSLTMVIVLDALAAVYFQEIGW